MEQLTQGMSQLFLAVEETQRSIISITSATLKTRGNKAAAEGSAGASTLGGDPPVDPGVQRKDSGKQVTKPEGGDTYIIRGFKAYFRD